MTGSESINITPMTIEEARECTEEIRKYLATIETMRQRLLEMERRQGFSALGYSSWREWALQEYREQSQAYLYRLLASARVQANLATVSTIVETNLPVSQLAELDKLPPEQQLIALRLADELAATENKPRTAKHVSTAVSQLKPPKAKKTSQKEAAKQPTNSNKALSTANSSTAATAPTSGLHEYDREQDNCSTIELYTEIQTLQQFNPLLSSAVEACLCEFRTPTCLDESLQGKVFIYPAQAQQQWSNKLLKAYREGFVTEAIALVPLNHQSFIQFADYALCPLPENKLAVYLGSRIDRFILCFEELGTVWYRYGLFESEKAYQLSA